MCFTIIDLTIMRQYIGYSSDQYFSSFTPVIEPLPLLFCPFLATAAFLFLSILFYLAPVKGWQGWYLQCNRKSYAPTGKIKIYLLHILNKLYNVTV